MTSLVRLSIRPQSDHKTDSQSFFQSLVVPVFKTMHGSYQNIKKKNWDMEIKHSPKQVVAWLH